MAARDLTTGPVPLLVVRLALPVLGALVLQSAYQLTDLFFVGLLGGAQLAVLSIAMNAFFLAMGLAYLVGSGALALIAQAYGAGRRERVPLLFQQALWLALLLGGALWLAATLGARPFLAWFSADGAVVAAGVPYVRVFALTLPAQVVLLVVGMCFRAVGDFSTPTLVLGLGVALNVALDPLLIFGPGPFPALGLVGAAVATLIAQLASLSVYLWLLLRPGAVLAPRAPLRVVWADGLAILRIGGPMGLLALLSTVTLVVMIRVVRPFGADATAAVGLGFRIIETAIFPFIALGAAAASLAGQNFGAARPERVRATILAGCGIATAVGVAECGLLLAAPRFWAGLFSADPGVVAVGADYLMVLAPTLVLVAAGIVAEHVGIGLGRTLLPLLAQAVRVAAFLGVLVLLVNVWELGLAGVFWSRAASIVPETLVLLGVLAYWWVTQLRPVAAPPDRPEQAQREHLKA